jgi:phospholipase C
MPVQEKGIRPSCALPYELYAEAKLSADKKHIMLQLEARNELYRERAAGSPFLVYSEAEAFPRAYAVKPGDRLNDAWQLGQSTSENYRLEIHGPNGFYRMFAGNRDDPAIEVTCDYSVNSTSPTGDLRVTILNSEKNAATVAVTDKAYKRAPETRTVIAGGTAMILLDLAASFGWYDISVTILGAAVFERRYAGRVETGRNSFTDPVMGRIL